MAGGAPSGKLCSCGARCVWAKFRDSGRFVLLDPEPVPGGNLAMGAKEHYADRVPRVWVARPGERAGHPVQLGLDPDDDRPLAWRAHFSSCPDADKHRRQR